jgi:hypothetical protein
MKDVKGAYIKCMGLVVCIDKVLYSHKEMYGWDIEFIDTEGNYRHWKQWDDGGEIDFPKKKLINCYGSDCTELFRKYGYDV